jgi:hypothetical protein
MLLVIKVTESPKWVSVYDGVLGRLILDEVLSPKSRKPGDGEEQEDAEEPCIEKQLKISARDGVGDIVVRVGRTKGTTSRTYRNRAFQGECRLTLPDEILDGEDHPLENIRECEWE